MVFVSDRDYLSRLYARKFGAPPNLDRPVGFNEKILHKILNDRRPLLTLFADKLRVRDFVRHTAPSLSLPGLYWWSARADALPFRRLPRQFVLKANHGSGWNLIVRDKEDLQCSDVSRMARKWLESDFTIVGRERFYEPIRRAVFAEELLSGGKAATLPDDYKLFVFGGKVRIIQVDHDRFGRHSQVLYDRDWTLVPGTVAAAQGSEIAPPGSLAQMIAAAEALSLGVDFVRVDLYDVEGHVYFGELTNSPNKGLSPFQPRSLDRALGDFMAIDDYARPGPVGYVPESFSEAGIVGT